MSITVTMPQLGETLTEGTILRWAKQPGDTIREDEVLLEISTDKVDTEVPSPAAGTILEILVPEGQTVAVGTPLALIGEPGEAIGSAAPSAAPSTAGSPAVEATTADGQTAQPPLPTPPPPPPEPVPPAPTLPVPQVTPPGSQGRTGDLGMLSPVVRRLASEHGVDLDLVTGTGGGGRITRKDVEAFVAAGGTRPVAAAPPPTPPIPAPQPPVELPPRVVPVTPPEPVQVSVMPSQPVPVPVPAAGMADGRVEQLDRLRVRIAENMTRSKQTAAHVWTSVEVDFEHVQRVRSRHNAAFKEREGFSLTFLPFISRAVVDALDAFPVVNSSFDLAAKTRTFHGQVNLGIGVDLDEGGLVVMTMRGADGLRMRGIAREIRRLAAKAREGKIELDDITGSTFTITNPGPYGSLMSAPIINLPNVAILSTDTIVKRPVVITDNDANDAIAIHHVGYLGMTWDHRAFDGSTAVKFLARIKEDIETWEWEQELA